MNSNTKILLGYLAICFIVSFLIVTRKKATTEACSEKTVILVYLLTVFYLSTAGVMLFFCVIGLFENISSVYEFLAKYSKPIIVNKLKIEDLAAGGFGLIIVLIMVSILHVLNRPKN